jgi:hypothetical protein
VSAADVGKRESVQNLWSTPFLHALIEIDGKLRRSMDGSLTGAGFRVWRGVTSFL